MDPESFASVLIAAAAAHEACPCEETENFIKTLVTGFLAEEE